MLETAMTHDRKRNNRVFLLLAFAAAGLLACGCGDRYGVGLTYPVRGKVTLNGEPWTNETTAILCVPNPDKGNTGSHEPAGTVDREGVYKLSTKGKKGAPPGWYKVVVTAHDSQPQHAKTPKMKSVAKSPLAPKYGQAKTTDLEIEVVENPASGAYDLKLVK